MCDVGTVVGIPERLYEDRRISNGSNRRRRLCVLARSLVRLFVRSTRPPFRNTSLCLSLGVVTSFGCDVGGHGSITDVVLLGLRVPWSREHDEIADSQNGTT